MPGTRLFFVFCLGLALLLLITLPALGARFALHPIPDEVAQGFRIWQADDCASCHTLAGQGGGYAPDLTRIYTLRGERDLRDFLSNPAGFTTNPIRTVSHRALTDVETEAVLAFLKWAEENTGLFSPIFQPIPEEKGGLIRSRPLLTATAAP